MREASMISNHATSHPSHTGHEEQNEFLMILMNFGTFFGRTESVNFTTLTMSKTHARVMERQLRHRKGTCTTMWALQHLPLPTTP